MSISSVVKYIYIADNIVTFKYLNGAENMATIDSRLLNVIEQVKAGFNIPIIVEYKSNPTTSDQQEMKDTGAKVVRVSKIGPFITGKATSNEITKLANIANIKKISYDEPVYTADVLRPMSATTATQVTYIPPNDVATKLGANTSYDDGYDGDGIKIAVIDTGVDETHPMLAEAIYKTYSLIEGEETDGNGHGTHVAGIALGQPTNTPKFDAPIHGIAPGAQLIAIKVLSDSGTGSMSDIVAGMEKAVELGADIINMSLGTNFDNAGVSPDSQMVNLITNEYGIPCVVAAGNSFINGTIGSPGAASRAITIGSVAMFKPMPNIVSSFSSKGPTSDMRMKPTFATYGGNVTTDIKEVIYSSTAGGISEELNGDRYAGLMGTSMATPAAAGLLALLLQQGLDGSNVDYVKNLFAYTATNAHPQNVFDGYGILNADKARKYIGKSVPPITQLNNPLNTFSSAILSPLSKLLSGTEYEQATGVRLPYIM